MAVGTTPHSKRPVQTRGYSIPLVFCFPMLLFALAATSCWRVQHELSSRSNHERALRARYAARTGLQRALANLSRDSAWQPPLFREQLSGGLAFEVEVLNNFAQTSPTVAPDGTEVPAGRVWLRSTGLVDGWPARGVTRFECQRVARSEDVTLEGHISLVLGLIREVRERRFEIEVESSVLPLN